MPIAVFICIGFMLAVLYIDLMFDVTAVPHRGSNTTLPKEVLDPITLYYGRITQNPYVLMFVMLTTTVCLVMEIVYSLVPRWAGYSSLVFMVLAMGIGSAKVIPAAQRLASGRDPEELRTRLIHSMFPAHVLLLICIILLAAIQAIAAGTPVR
jgi:hypothetical protein